MSPISDIAIDYIRRGWAPIPVPFRQKKPILENWQKLKITEADVPRYFNGGPQNIGVRFGPDSCLLTDVDLDAPEAVTAGSRNQDFCLRPRRRGQSAQRKEGRCDPRGRRCGA
jgi:Bifunctional DNA primase/polymerase, N-terminal